MAQLKLPLLYVSALFYVAVGVYHFVNPDFFLAIMPPYLPLHLELVYLSGFFEIVLGLLLVYSKTRVLAAWGLILLLIAVFPANIHLAMSAEAQAALKTTEAVAIGRLPFQLLFIGLAYWFTRD
ncbi:MAG: DoxX family protein [Myxococcales bacterium]|nr:DoxX family protein [Myxococcales bacterium]